MNARLRLIVDFGLKVFLPACLAAAGIGMVMLYIMNSIFSEANALDKQYARRAAEAAINVVLERMESLTRDNALWDDAIRNSYEPVNRQWAHETWGVATDLGLYNQAYIVDDRGRTLFAYENGDPQNRTVQDSLGPLIDTMLAGLPDNARDFATASGLFRKATSVYAVSVAPILPSSANLGLPQARPNRLVFAKLIDAPLLQALGEQHVLEGLRLATDSSPDDEELALKSIDGTTIGYLTWASRSPGDIARNKYGDVIRFMFLTIFIVMGGLVYVSWLNFRDANIGRTRAVERSLRDELTGLPNRRMVISELTKLLEERQDRKGALAILYADLDGFKEVNDAYGHEVGDELLRAVAAGFQFIVGDKGFVARLGGDEFAIVVNAPDASAVARHTAAAMIEFLAVPLNFSRHQASVGVSVGIVDHLEGQPDAEELLRRADVAMYAAKGSGRNRSCLYLPEMDRHRDTTKVIAAQLRDAIAAGTLGVVYQPIVDAATHHIVSAEALVRWPASSNHVIQPDVFVPIAEQYGLIQDLGRLVLERACQAAAGWPDICICVNISPMQFKNPAFPHEVENVLRRTGLRGDRLELEISESCIIENTERAAAAIRRLHDIGVSVSLDDFGTGFSSIGQLRKLEFDRVKLDRSLVKDVLLSPQALLLLRATIAMADALELPTTAEGVENEQQVPLLRLSGCQLLQGYLFSHPISAGEFSRLLLPQPAGSAVSA